MPSDAAVGRRLRNKKLSMLRVAHLFNGIIQINFKQFCKSSWNRSAFLSDVPPRRLPRHEALKSHSGVYSHEAHFKQFFIF